MREYYLLIAVLAVLTIGAVKGYAKGFLRLAVWFAGLIAVLFIVTRISPYVSNFIIENTSVYEQVREKIIRTYEEKSSAGTDDVMLPDNADQNEVIDSFGFPDLISDSIKINNNSEIYEKLAVSLFKDYVAGFLSALAIKAGTFAGLFILLAIAEFVILTAIKILEKIPVLRTFNRLAGMAAGITLALVFIWVFFIAAMMFFGNSFSSWVFAQVKASRLLTIIFNNNILFDLIR
ncbi:MAG: hypothetical protein K6E49_02470 [Lachnospiraceae bacterium]|nr:hypothetical protein [Lachnospiraceae bacterium]